MIHIPILRKGNPYKSLTLPATHSRRVSRLQQSARQSGTDRRDLRQGSDAQTLVHDNRRRDEICKRQITLNDQLHWAMTTVSGLYRAVS